MTKFIEISTDQGLVLINVTHIVFLQEEDRGATLILSDLREIKTENNFQEIKKLLES